MCKRFKGIKDSLRGTKAKSLMTIDHLKCLTSRQVDMKVFCSNVAFNRDTLEIDYPESLQFLIIKTKERKEIDESSGELSK